MNKSKSIFFILAKNRLSIPNGYCTCKYATDPNRHPPLPAPFIVRATNGRKDPPDSSKDNRQVPQDDNSLMHELCFLLHPQLFRLIFRHVFQDPNQIIPEFSHGRDFHFFIGRVNVGHIGTDGDHIQTGVFL